MGKKIQPIEKKEKNDNGMTIIEIAIAMTILGVIIAGLISILNPIIESGKRKATEAKIERIIDIMAIYAQRNNRIPCPSNPDQTVVAQPFGAEVGSGGGGTAIGNCTGAGGLLEGIVPYKTLGMSEQDIIDGWGNYLSYRVAPAYTRDSSAALTVHSRCRTELIWIDDTTLTNRNPAKARFCCANPAAGNDFAIVDENNAPLWNFTRDVGNYAAANTSVPSDTVFDPANNNVTMPAFLLISHGKNERGAFLVNGARVGAIGASGLDEVENQDTDNNFVTSPRNTIQTNAHFDDILIWRTQDQLYSETGEGSCVFP